MASQQFCLFDTAFGAVGLAWSEQGLTRLQLPEASRAATERRLGVTAQKVDSAAAPPMAQQAIALLKRYFEGEQVDFSDLPLDFDESSDFDRQIYALACEVGWGKTTTYGELAKRANVPAPHARSDGPWGKTRWR